MYAESHNEVIIRDEYNLCILRFNDQGDTDIEVTNSKTKGVWEHVSWCFDSIKLLLTENVQSKSTAQCMCETK